MTACPYCENISLRAGREGAPPATEFDTVLAHDSQMVVTPTLGMLTPGYLLAITRDHIPNFGCLGRAALEENTRSFLRELLIDLEAEFGPYMLFEHGTARDEPPRQGGCVTHAHLHLIPVEERAVVETLASLAWEPIRGLSDLADAAGPGYAYLSYEAAHYIVVGPHLAGQWIRRTLAPFLNDSDGWDWGVSRGDAQLRETLERLPEHLRKGLLPNQLPASHASS